LPTVNAPRGLPRRSAGIKSGTGYPLIFSIQR
jgi:hypothetical protein